MSFIIEYDHGTLKQCRKTRERTTPSPLYYNSDRRFICCGELFGMEYSELMEMPWKNEPSLLTELDGAVAVAEASETKLYFASDLSTAETLFFYHRGSRFILSDEFWEIVRLIEPTLDDINREYLEQSMFVMGHLKGETVVRGIHTLRGGRLCTFDAEKNAFTEEHYTYYHYTETCHDIDEAVEHFDQILDSAMEKIKAKCGDVSYGLGISGGLDSRIVAHYASKHHMKLQGYNICVPKPHHLFYGRGIKNAKQIADTYHIPLSIVQWQPDHLRQKIRKSIAASPTYNGNAFKYETEGMPQFDVMLHGGCGYFVNQHLPLDMRNTDPEGIKQLLYKEFLDVHKTSFSSRARRALSYIFKIDVSHKKETQEDWFIGCLMGNGYVPRLQKEISDYVDGLFQDNMNNMEVMMDPSMNVYGYMNRHGAFESMFGAKRSFAIYTPFLIQEAGSLGLEILWHRKIVEKLIEKKIPEVSHIKSESFAGGPGSHQNFLTKTMTLLEFLIRGNSTAIDQHYLGKKSIRKELLNDLNQNTNDWFHQLMHMEGIQVTDKILRHEPSRMLARIWELKCLIDCLEKKDYPIN